jgi:hypothetical protein
MRYTIGAADGSGDRIVRFVSAHSWANDPADDRARQAEDRIVLLEGAPLPDWAIVWLEAANAKQCRGARAAFRAAIEDADAYQDRRDADSY